MLEQTQRLPGFEQVLRLVWEPNLAFEFGQAQGLPSVFLLKLRELSGLAQGFWLELEQTFGFLDSVLWKALQG